MKCDLRETVFVRRKDVLSANLGITRKQWQNARAEGALDLHYLPGSARPVYLREDVLRVFGIKENGHDE